MYGDSKSVFCGAVDWVIKGDQVCNKVVIRLPVNRLPVKLPVTGFNFQLPVTDLRTFFL